MHYAHYKNELGKRSLRYWSVIIWNCISSLNLKMNVKPVTFKKILKNALLNGELVLLVYK